MADTTEENFIGKGLKFPIQLDNLGKAVVVSSTDLVETSIRNILSWPNRTRFFLAEFGSRVETLLEEPNDTVLQGLVRHYVIDALNQWEKRIEVLDVQLLVPSDNELHLKIKYRILNTQIENSFIFPYYTSIIF